MVGDIPRDFVRVAWQTAAPGLEVTKIGVVSAAGIVGAGGEEIFGDETIGRRHAVLRVQMCVR